jgi:hypothetical protein
MIKLKKVLESSARNRMKKRVEDRIIGAELSKEERKIRAIIDKELESSKGLAELEWIEWTGTIIHKALPANASTNLDDYSHRYYHEGPGRLGVGTRIKYFFNDAYVDFGTINHDISSEQFLSLLIQDCNKATLEKSFNKQKRTGHSFPVEVYIKVLAVFSLMYSTKLFSIPISNY